MYVRGVRAQSTVANCCISAHLGPFASGRRCCLVCSFIFPTRCKGIIPMQERLWGGQPAGIELQFIYHPYQQAVLQCSPVRRGHLAGSNPWLLHDQVSNQHNKVSLYRCRLPKDPPACSRLGQQPTAQEEKPVSRKHLPHGNLAMTHQQVCSLFTVCRPAFRSRPAFRGRNKTKHVVGHCAACLQPAAYLSHCSS